MTGRVLAEGASVFVTHDTLGSDLARLLLQIVVIVGVCRVLATLLRKFKQPTVIAEVIGGILLGPTAMSRIPLFASTIFPSTSQPILSVVANLGLCIFMFCVGLELDFGVMRRNIRKSFMISSAGIIVPFALGAALAVYIHELYPSPGLSSGGHAIAIDDFTFILFVGTAMAITAFPVLARILVEQRLLGTRLGTSAMNAAALDDVVAWTILALVIALARGSGSGLAALWTALSTLAFALFVTLIARPIMTAMVLRRAPEVPGPIRACSRGLANGVRCMTGTPAVPASASLATQDASIATASAGQIEVGAPVLAVTFIWVFTCAWITEFLGVHAIFGAFIAGAAMPRARNLHIGLAGKVEDVVIAVFMPLYFAFSGLRTDFTKLNDGQSWGIAFLVIVVASVGKLGGCSIASRISGLSWRESVGIGLLMNCKGLVELIVLNVGLDLGVISPVVFAIFVFMALILTLVTVPGLQWWYPPDAIRADAARMETEARVAAMAAKTAAAGGNCAGLGLAIKDAGLLLVAESPLEAANLVSVSEAIAGKSFRLLDGVKGEDPLNEQPCVYAMRLVPVSESLFTPYMRMESSRNLAQLAASLQAEQISSPGPGAVDVARGHSIRGGRHGRLASVLEDAHDATEPGSGDCIWMPADELDGYGYVKRQRILNAPARTQASPAHATAFAIDAEDASDHDQSAVPVSSSISPPQGPASDFGRQLSNNLSNQQQLGSDTTALVALERARGLSLFPWLRFGFSCTPDPAMDIARAVHAHALGAILLAAIAVPGGGPRPGVARSRASTGWGTLLNWGGARVTATSAAESVLVAAAGVQLTDAGEGLLREAGTLGAPLVVVASKGPGLPPSRTHNVLVVVQDVALDSEIGMLTLAAQMSRRAEVHVLAFSSLPEPSPSTPTVPRTRHASAGSITEPEDPGSGSGSGNASTPKPTAAPEAAVTRAAALQLMPGRPADVGISVGGTGLGTTDTDGTAASITTIRGLRDYLQRTIIGSSAGAAEAVTDHTAGAEQGEKTPVHGQQRERIAVVKAPARDGGIGAAARIVLAEIIRAQEAGCPYSLVLASGLNFAPGPKSTATAPQTQAAPAREPGLPQPGARTTEGANDNAFAPAVKTEAVAVDVTVDGSAPVAEAEEEADVSPLGTLLSRIWPAQPPGVVSLAVAHANSHSAITSSSAAADGAKRLPWTWGGQTRQS